MKTVDADLRRIRALAHGARVAVLGGKRWLSTCVIIMAVCVQANLVSALLAQAPSFSIYPMRIELEASPGVEKTTAFEIKAAPSLAPERGRLVLSLTDWQIREDGSVTYAEPGSTERSASPWIIFSPSALTTEPGRSQLVRITVKVPEKTQPGVYRSGLFIQERPPATPPGSQERVINLRVRYEFTLYVIVAPVSARPELVTVEVDGNGHPPSLVCEMKNSGNGYVRPLVSWNIRRRGPTAEAATKGRRDATVLLPYSTLREAYSLQNLIPTPGAYDITVIVDFQDGQPQQSMTRPFEVANSALQEAKGIGGSH
jgi:fimbrial chaperone protein